MKSSLVQRIREARRLGASPLNRINNTELLRVNVWELMRGGGRGCMSKQGIPSQVTQFVFSNFGLANHISQLSCIKDYLYKRRLIK